MHRLLRLEDQLRGHKAYTRAAHSAIACYLSLLDTSGNVAKDGQGDDMQGSEETAGMSEKEIKKLRSKQRRDQARAAATKPDDKPKGTLALPHGVDLGWHASDPRVCTPCTGDDAKKGKKSDTDPDGAALVNVCCVHASRVLSATRVR